MKIETYEQRVLTPEMGCWLYNAQVKVISDKVYLGKEADVSAWAEITDKEKQHMETQWAQEAHNQSEG